MLHRYRDIYIIYIDVDVKFGSIAIHNARATKPRRFLFLSSWSFLCTSSSSLSSAFESSEPDSSSSLLPEPLLLLLDTAGRDMARWLRLVLAKAASSDFSAIRKTQHKAEDAARA